MELFGIFLTATLINNFVLAQFLGICPFLGVSGKLATASRMGGAVMFVMLVSSVCAYGIHRLLVAIDGVVGRGDAALFLLLLVLWALSAAGLGWRLGGGLGLLGGRSREGDLHRSRDIVRLLQGRDPRLGLLRDPGEVRAEDIG